MLRFVVHQHGSTTALTALDLTGVRAILLDVEGTTTPVAFVYETLFPYARRELRPFVERHREQADFEALMARLRAEHDRDAADRDDVPEWDDSSPARDESVVRYVSWLMDHDRKSPALKDLQGRMWKNGYERGGLVGEVFEDVAPALRRWQQAGLITAIFSSGSVLAQRLLFGYSTAGDLTPFVHQHFDTAVGAKAESASYRRIAEALGVQPSAVLFVSDAVQELDAARVAGVRTALSVRPGNTPVHTDHHPAVLSFDELGG